MHYSQLVQSQLKDVKFSAAISIFLYTTALLLCANSDVLLSLVGVALFYYADFCLIFNLKW